MYGEGQGLSQDYVQAHMWLNLAAAQLPALGTNQRNSTVDAREVYYKRDGRQQVIWRRLPSSKPAIPAQWLRLRLTSENCRGTARKLFALD
jgi:TPR repeat protein